MVIRLFFTLLISMVVLLPGITMAEDSSGSGFYSSVSSLSEYENIKYNSVDDVFDNLANRLMLSAFGKDVFAFFIDSYTDKAVVNQIKNLSKSEMEDYSRPFNIHMSNVVWVIMSLSSILAVATLLIYLAWVLFERWFMLSESGNIFDRGVNAVTTNLKFIMIVMLVLPIISFNGNGDDKSGNISVIHLGIIKTIGYSSLVSDKIFEIYTKNIPAKYPSIPIPTDESVMEAFVDMILFSACVHTDSGVEPNSEIEVKFYSIGDSEYRAVARTQGCALAISTSFDDDIGEMMTESLKLIGESSKAIDYRAFQENIFRDEIKKALDASSVLGEVISKVSNINKKVPGKMDGVTDFAYEKCDDKIANLSGEQIKTDVDMIDTIRHLSKCLSSSFVGRYVAVPGVDVMAYERDRKNYIADRNIELCTHNFTGNKSREVIASSTKAPLTTVSGSKIEEYPKKDIIECLSESCGSLGSPYMCANAVSFVNDYAKKIKMAKKGWITSGGYMYSIMSGEYSAVAGRNMINNFKVANSFRIELRQSTPSNYLMSEANDNISTTFRVGETNPQNRKILERSIFYGLPYYKLISSEIKRETDNLVVLVIGAFDDLFGRLTTCIQRPMTMTSGYSCGSTTMELRRFGDDIIITSIGLKLGYLIAEIMRGGSAGEEHGSTNEAKLPNLGFVLKSVMSLVTVVAGGTASSTPDMLGSFVDSSIDKFNPANKDIIELMVGTLVGTSATAISNESVLEAIDTGIYAIFLIGILIGYVIPLIPIFMWITAIIGWLISVVQTIIVFPIWVATLIGLTQEANNSAVKVGFRLIMSTLIRLPLMTIGLIVGWVLSNIFIQYAVSGELIAMTVDFKNSNIIIMATDMIIILIVYVIMLYVVYSMLFSLINGFHEITMNWIGDDDYSSTSAMGKSGQETQVVTGTYSQYSSQVKNLKWSLSKA